MVAGGDEFTLVIDGSDERIRIKATKDGSSHVDFMRLAWE